MFDRNKSDDPFGRLTHAAWSRMPAHERVLDRLADLLLDADEMLAILAAEDAVAERWLEPHVQRLYNDVDVLMRRLTD